MADAWGNVIDEVHYFDNNPWPWEADGEGPYLELIDLDLDNSLPESWTLGYDVTAVPESKAEEGFRVYPNPANEFITVIISDNGISHEYCITNIMGQTLQSGPLSDRIDVSKIPSGIYFITIAEVTQKVVVR